MVTNFTSTEMPDGFTILHLSGQLDSSNSSVLIHKARSLLEKGTCNPLLDLGKLTYLGGAGLGAFLELAQSFKSEADPGQEEKRIISHQVVKQGKGSNPQRRIQRHVKLFCPSVEIMNVLVMTRFNSFFEVFTDQCLAFNSFPKPAARRHASISK
jgi:anti-anti-sigma regulatory factor